MDCKPMDWGPVLCGSRLGTNGPQLRKLFELVHLWHSSCSFLLGGLLLFYQVSFRMDSGWNWTAAHNKNGPGNGNYRKCELHYWRDVNDYNFVRHFIRLDQVTLQTFIQEKTNVTSQ